MWRGVAPQLARRFTVVGHDRGGRVGYRLALDHPERVVRLAVLDILPTETAWGLADARFALGYWPWSLLAQPEPLPERLLVAAGAAIVDDALGGWGERARRLSPGGPRRLRRGAERPRARSRHLRGVPGGRDARPRSRPGGRASGRRIG
jgi:pimeloyl-ACP methyl ester carboxylesterase